MAVPPAAQREAEGDRRGDRIGELEADAEPPEVRRAAHRQRGQDRGEPAEDRRQQEQRGRQHVARVELHHAARAQCRIIAPGKGGDREDVDPGQAGRVHRIEGRGRIGEALRHAQEDHRSAGEEQREQHEAGRAERPVQGVVARMDEPALGGEQRQPQGRGHAVRVHLQRRGADRREIARPEGQRREREYREQIPMGVTVRHVAASPCGSLQTIADIAGVNAARSSGGGEAAHHVVADLVLLLADHAGDQEQVDQQPDEADHHEIGEDLQDRRHRLAQIEAVRADEPQEQPEEIGHGHARRVVRHALLDQRQFGNRKRHPIPQGACEESRASAGPVNRFRRRSGRRAGDSSSRT
uniref:LigA n=1 Tax=Globodera pallida TaxID=36090 RepID=A0A183CGA3_GLOPA